MAAPKGNKYAEGLTNSGRPPLFNSIDELTEKIISYFKSITNKDNITVSGLAFYLGFESRQSLYDYEKHEEFSYIIKRARLIVECEYENKLSTYYVTGAIFALKNMGWFDKSQTELTGKDGEQLMQPLNDTQVEKIIQSLRENKHEAT